MAARRLEGAHFGKRSEPLDIRRGWTALLRSPLLPTLKLGLCVRCAQREDLGQPLGPPQGLPEPSRHRPSSLVLTSEGCLGSEPRPGTPSLGKA